MTSEERLTEGVDPEDVEWFRKQLRSWGDDHLRDFPWRETSSPYEILVAEVLLQQTDAPRVEPVYREFLHRFPAIEDLAEADLSDVRDVLHPLGFHFRADRLVAIARSLTNSPAGGKVPADESALLDLPGVGSYIARSVLSHAYGVSVAVLDTNVTRILLRFFGLESNRARPRRDPEVDELAQHVALNEEVSRWNLILLDFGASVCTARSPSCGECPLAQRCHYAQQDKEADS